MLTTSTRVMVAVTDDESREHIAQNLQADGHVPVMATGLGQDTRALIDAVREQTLTAVDPGMPIIALTPSEEVFDWVRLLEQGADDVICDPWLYIEIRARLAAIVRRTEMDRHPVILRAGGLRVDVKARRAWVGEQEVKLTSREFDLLRVLASDPDRVFTRQELLKTVWGLGDWAHRTRTLDQHASRLRRRLNITGECYICTVWGTGYRLSDSGLVTV